MTVCIAVICGPNAILGMSDRMLTAGDVQFQPSTSKVWPITSSIVMMSSGDVGLQTEIYSAVLGVVNARIKAQPKDWWQVKEVADLYRKSYFDIKKRRAEQKILLPLGLDSESFLSKQPGMHSDLVSKIGMELVGYELPGVAALIAGNDPSPPGVDAHIFMIRDGELSCHDKVGFACVGVGAWHANSTLMLAGHTPDTPVNTALLNLYTAKKRAEVAPGVGGETDAFIVGPTLGGYSELRDDIRDAVFKAYETQTKSIVRAQKRAQESLDEYIAQITAPKPAGGSQTAEQPEPQPSPDKAAV